MAQARTSEFLILEDLICIFFFKFTFCLKSRKIALWSKTVLESALSIVQFATFLISDFDMQKKSRRDLFV